MYVHTHNRLIMRSYHAIHSVSHQIKPQEFNERPSSFLQLLNAILPNNLRFLADPFFDLPIRCLLNGQLSVRPNSCNKWSTAWAGIDVEHLE